MAITIPVMSLDDFFPIYLELLRRGEVQALGRLYADDAVLTSTEGPEGTTWSVGRAQIVANLEDALRRYRVIDETPPDSPFDVRGNLAARCGTFSSTIEPVHSGPRVTLDVEAFEVFSFTEADGWRYLADHTRVLSATRPSHGSD